MLVGWVVNLMTNVWIVTYYIFVIINENPSEDCSHGHYQIGIWVSVYEEWIQHGSAY